MKAVHLTSNGEIQVLATEATSHIRCTKCGNEYTRPGSTFVNDLLYPPIVSITRALNNLETCLLTDIAQNPYPKPKVYQTHLLSSSEG